jgi:CPA1 family monovalent cation:H+ antiporter
VSETLLFGVLGIGIVVLTPLARRIRVPQPVLLTLFGLALALLPFTTALHLDPDLILPVVLPPLLFAATQRTTAREFREHAGAVLLLAVGLTIATTAVVAVVGHLLGLPWTAAAVLGAIVSPPDPVAATAVARRLRLPQRLVSVLEGEGMFNDATALVLYKVAVAVTVTGAFSAGMAVLELVLAVVVGLGIGLVLGWVTKQALALLHEAAPETTVTVMAPFGAYLGAERLHGSGVLAVLALGLYLRSYGHGATSSRGWLLGRAVWIFPAAWFARVRARRRDYPSPAGWRESAVVSWAGMRGVVTVATALALPMAGDSGAPFPRRHDIVLVALLCVLVTLVVQGLTLAPLTSRLRVAAEPSGRHEVSRLRRRAAEAALRQVQADTSEDVTPEVREAAVLQYEGYINAQSAMMHARTTKTDGDVEAAEELREVMGRAIAVERDLVLTARRRGEVSAETADEVLRDIETRAVRDFG